MLETFEPGVVVVNNAISDKFSDTRQARRYGRGVSEFKRRQEYYEALRGGKVGYMLIRDFGEIQVYARQ